jgi:hypothetical protein
MRSDFFLDPINEIKYKSWVSLGARELIIRSIECAESQIEKNLSESNLDSYNYEYNYNKNDINDISDRFGYVDNMNNCYTNNCYKHNESLLRRILNNIKSKFSCGRIRNKICRMRSNKFSKRLLFCIILYFVIKLYRKIR